MPLVFAPLLQKLGSDNQFFSEPLNFIDYVKTHNLPTKGTANHISVQGFSDLDSELKKDGWMVFRLGSRPSAKGTFFGLIKTVGGWNDYFFFDNVAFNSKHKLTLSPDWSSDKLIAFGSIPNLTETSYVNLALALNLFKKALGLEALNQSIPATGRGNYSFEVYPNDALPEKSWQHLSGQVEIDSIFTATYKGQKHLVVVEAKTSKNFDSLSKYKLGYPVLALQQKVDLPILPIYLRVIESKKGILFHFGLCNTITKNKRFYINQLEITDSSSIELIN